jgi:hypothetical protein
MKQKLHRTFPAPPIDFEKLAMELEAEI